MTLDVCVCVCVCAMRRLLIYKVLLKHLVNLYMKKLTTTACIMVLISLRFPKVHFHNHTIHRFISDFNEKKNVCLYYSITVNKIQF